MTLAAALTLGGAPRQTVTLTGLGFLAAMVVHDVRSLRVPDRLTAAALGVVAAGMVTLGPPVAANAAVGTAIAFGVMLAIAMLGRGAMGAADVKTAAICGMLVGWPAAGLMLLLTSVISGTTASVVLALRLRQRRDAMAFTPFLAAGTVITLVYLGGPAWA
jgi:prepilin signal peptidase PulO-like enzyme (type II secretory pathway)